MRSRSIWVFARILLICSLCPAQNRITPSHEDKFRSFDGKMVALVWSTKTSGVTSESRVELRTQSGRILAKRDYGSEDGEHGYGITKAAWTPDSQFFVYSLESSGGHSPWHSPVEFLSRKQRKIISLDDSLKDAVMNPQFLIGPPDNVTVDLWFSKQTRTVSLSQLPKP